MRDRVDRIFSDADRDAIRDATTRAELSTAGEIVCYLVDESDEYPEVTWKAACFGSVLAALLAALWRQYVGGWGAPDHIWVLVALSIGGLLGSTVAMYWPACRRLLVGYERMALRAEQRALRAFSEEKIFTTEDRIGLLIFVSLFEHKAVVLADEGIHKNTPAGTWDGVVARLVAGMKSQSPTRAVIESIDACGALLHQYAGPRRSSDVDELPDEPRFE